MTCSCWLLVEQRDSEWDPWVNFSGNVDSTNTSPRVLHLPLLFLQNGLGNICTTFASWRQVSSCLKCRFWCWEAKPYCGLCLQFLGFLVALNQLHSIWTYWDRAPCGGKAEQWKMVASSYFLSSSPKLLFKDAAIITMPLWRGLVELSHQPPLEQYPCDASCRGLQ